MILGNIYDQISRVLTEMKNTYASNGELVSGSFSVNQNTTRCIKVSAVSKQLLVTLRLSTRNDDTRIRVFFNPTELINTGSISLTKNSYDASFVGTDRTKVAVDYKETTITSVLPVLEDNLQAAQAITINGTGAALQFKLNVGDSIVYEIKRTNVAGAVAGSVDIQIL